MFVALQGIAMALALPGQHVALGHLHQRRAEIVSPGQPLEVDPLGIAYPKTVCLGEEVELVLAAHLGEEDA